MLHDPYTPYHPSLWQLDSCLDQRTDLMHRDHWKATQKHTVQQILNTEYVTAQQCEIQESSHLRSHRPL